MDEITPAQVTPDLKILITSTPKTGNTWLRHLLAAIYDLPTTKLDFPFDPALADSFGPRWIAHQHYGPEPELLEWAERSGTVLITTTRHPGDVLVSLYHYVRSYRTRLDFHQLAAFADDDGTFGAPVREVLQVHFPAMNGISADWVASGLAHVVSYESLIFDPVAALLKLTAAISPISQDAIERAIERCDIRVMRSLAYENRSFFREGGYGGWRRTLPADIVELLRTIPPYPDQFATLNYTLGDDDPWLVAVQQRPPVRASFFEQREHSPATAALLKSIYLSFETEHASSRWPDAASTPRPNAFDRWLVEPAEADPTPEAIPPITNLMFQVYRQRIDLRKLFPDPFGKNRKDVAVWFAINVAAEYELDSYYDAALREWFDEWAVASAEPPVAGVPTLTNLAAYLYDQRADLQESFPNGRGEDRPGLLQWILVNAPNEHHIDPGLLEPIRSSLSHWAAAPDPADSEEQLPKLTNLATYLHAHRSDLQTAFPDTRGHHRIGLLRWVVAEGSAAFGLDNAVVEPLQAELTAWSIASDAADTEYGRVPVLNNLLAYFYQTRSDLQDAFPDPRGSDRISLLRWFIEHAEPMDEPVARAIRSSLAAWAIEKDGPAPLVYMNGELLKYKQLQSSMAGRLIGGLNALLAVVARRI